MRWLLAGTLALALAGCGHRRPPPPPPPPFVPTTIAILPFDNATASVDAPKGQRQALQERIARRGYVPIPLAEVDRALGELGVQLAGQLAVTSYDELREKLHADVAISGKVLQASALRVEAEVTFIDLRTKQVVMTSKRAVEGTEASSGIEGFVAAAAVAMVTKLHTAQGRLADVLVADIPWCPREAPKPPPPVVLDAPGP